MVIKKFLGLVSELANKSPAMPPEPPNSLAQSLLNEIREATTTSTRWQPFELKQFEIGRVILQSDPQTQRSVVLDLIPWLTEKENARRGVQGYLAQDEYSRAVKNSVDDLLRRSIPFSEDEVVKLLDWSLGYQFNAWRSVSRIIKQLQDFQKREGKTTKLNVSLENYIKTVSNGAYNDAETREQLRKLNDLLGREVRNPLVPGETWSDEALRFVDATEQNHRLAWIEFLNDCLAAKGSTPTAKWSKSCEASIARIGWEEFRGAMLDWFPLVDKPRTVRIETWSQYSPDPNQLINDQNADILKGLVWASAIKSDADLVRAITTLAICAYKKVPRIGPRCVRVGNACIWALSSSDAPNAVGSLAVLKVRVRFGTAQKAIEKAFAQAATRANLPKDEIEEMSVPDHGLQGVGRMTEKLGDYRAELVVNETDDASLMWFTSEGKQLKSVPASVKKDHPEELKELNQSLKDIRQMLPAQRTRIDCLFLEQKKWPFETWRTRYHEHALVGTIARRLIWKFSIDSAPFVSAIWLDGKFVTSNGDAFEFPADSTSVELWHPLDEPTGAVLSWRDFLEKLEIRQPFKQAHREVYILTDAERNTQVYSNRYAAHLLKQHQFNALCAARGWKNKLRMMVDDEYPPATRSLPQWNLRAEFWIEGAGSAYGVDTNEAGAYLYLTTDQVRFYRVDDAENSAHAGGGGYGHSGWRREVPPEPVAIEQVPPLVLSEVMRDVDLFVGVSSVGNDPNWLDNGQDGARTNYWNEYSFGELSVSARTRKEILEKIVPRLKIASRCSFDDKFLIVKGNIRSYKIHLGSGNILMNPNDQYLCIVAGQSSTKSTKVFLPFEGDQRIAVILSKAFMLAEDNKINDPTIVTQISQTT